jgi:hypothetical protein
MQLGVVARVPALAVREVPEANAADPSDRAELPPLACASVAECPLRMARGRVYYQPSALRLRTPSLPAGRPRRTEQAIRVGRVRECPLSDAKRLRPVRPLHRPAGDARARGRAALRPPKHAAPSTAHLVPVRACPGLLERRMRERSDSLARSRSCGRPRQARLVARRTTVTGQDA